MQLIATLASLAGIEVEAFTNRLKRDAGAWAAVAVLIAIAVVFLLIALNAWMSAMLGPVAGPIAIAAGALVLALLTYLVTRALSAAAERREAEKRKAAERSALMTTAAITALPMLMQSGLFKRVGLPLGGVLAAAFLLFQGQDDDKKSDEDPQADEAT
jgi:uncharacterized BrkB/YihY/UPF0761 family membrane protein